MQRWEYCLVLVSPEEAMLRRTGQPTETITLGEQAEDAEDIGVLGSLGAEGWEAVGFQISPTADLMYFFKRPLEG